MPSSRRFRSFLAALLVVLGAGLITAAVSANAQTWPPWPQTQLSGAQLSASAAAAAKHGVPVNIERGVTTYKYGPASSTANFNLVAAQLAYWYKTLYPRYGGSAIVNWTRAAAAEMGQGASQLDVARATGNQQTAINTIVTGPFWVLVAGLLPGAEAIGAAAPGEVGISGTAAGPATTGGTAAAGSTAAGKASNPLSGGSSLDGTPASALSTAGMAALAGAATVFIADHISSDTQVNLTGGWFQSIYHTIENYAWLLAVLAVAAAGMHVLVMGATGAPTGLGILAVGVPKAALLMIVTPVLALAGIGIVDSMCSDLIRQFPEGVHLLHVMAAALGVLGGASVLASLAGHTTIAHFAGSGAWFIGAFGLITSGAVALELIAREIAIYLTVVIVPLAAVGELFMPFHKWATTLTKMLLAIIVTKLLLAIGLVMAGLMIMTGLAHFSPILMIVGLVTVGLMTLLPAVVYGALLRIEASWHSRVSSVAVGASAMARQHSLARQIRSGSTRVRGAQSHHHPPPPPARRPQPSAHPQPPLAQRQPPPVRRPSPAAHTTRQGSATTSGAWRSSNTPIPKEES